MQMSYYKQSSMLLRLFKPRCSYFLQKSSRTGQNCAQVKQLFSSWSMSQGKRVSNSKSFSWLRPGENQLRTNKLHILSSMEYTLQTELKMGKRRFSSGGQNIECYSPVSTTITEDDDTLEDQEDSDTDIYPTVRDNSVTKKFVHGHQHLYEINKDGYLSVDDLLRFLKFEGAMDICVIKTSGARSMYVDYFVVASGMTTRHLRAMAKNLEQLFRGFETRGVGRHGHVTVEGLESDHWLAVDIGNMVVHFFLPEMRDVYELEKLWVLGPEYDDQYQAMIEEEAFLKAVYLGDGIQHEEDTVDSKDDNSD